MFVGIALAVLAPVPNMEDGWFLDFEVASKVAERQGKAMMVDFTGSDWCGYCIQLDETVFSKDEFKEWARESVVKVKLDYPTAKKQPDWMVKQNQELLQKYGVQGFPTILFMNHEGEVIGRSGVLQKPGVEPWVTYADQIIESGQEMLTSFEPTEGYPPIVTEKDLYAENDFRGKKSPKLDFGQVLSDKKIDTKGKIVLVDYWATWCGPCRALIPELNEFTEKFKDDLVIVGLSDEEPATVQKFMKETKMNYHVTTDPKASMKSKLGVIGIPHVMVVTPDGIVRWQGWPQDPKDKLTEGKIQQIIDAWKASQASKA